MGSTRGRKIIPSRHSKKIHGRSAVRGRHPPTDRHCLPPIGKKKALLVGFSFGSLIGLQAVAESPERYHGYVGLSHFVTILESEEILDIEGRARAARKSETEILAKLEKIGPPPYKNHPQERVVNALIKNLVIEDTKNPFPASEYIGSALWSKYYKPQNFVGLALGRNFSGKALEDEIYTIDARDHVNRIEVPMLWISGKQDTTLSQTLAHEYFGQIKDPHGKEFIWLEDVAHPVHLEAPSTFQTAIREFSSKKLGVLK